MSSNEARLAPVILLESLAVLYVGILNLPNVVALITNVQFAQSVINRYKEVNALIRAFSTK